MAAANQDDNVVFGTPPQGGPPAPTENSGGQRLTVQDLYGPSTGESTGPVSDAPPPMEEAPPQQTPPPVEPPQSFQTQPAATIPPPPPIEEVPPPPAPPQPFPGGGIGGILHGKLKYILGAVGGIIVLFLIIGFFLNGSGGVVGGKATLTYWGLWEEPKTMQIIINDFKKQNPNIDIVYKKQTPDKYKDRIITRITNNSGTDIPDIFLYHNSWLPTMTSVLAPLPNTVITPEEFKKSYFPVVQNDVVLNGGIYGIPQGIETLSLFVNKEIFDAAGIQVPQTWDQFIRSAKALTVKDQTGKIRTAGAAVGTFDNIQHAPDIISLLFLQNGVDLQKLPDYRASIADALIFYTAFTKESDNVWDGSMNNSVAAFANGEVAMIFGYSWDIFAMKATNPNVVFEVHPVPNLPGKNTTVASYWVNGVSSKTKNQKEAMLFMQYLARKDVQQKLFTESSKTRDFGVPYATRDLAKTLQDNPTIYPFVEQAEFASSTYFASDTRDAGYNEKLNTYLGNAVRGILSGNSPQSATETLVQGVSQVRSQ